jgi:hypothetical protein
MPATNFYFEVLYSLQHYHGGKKQLAHQEHNDQMEKAVQLYKQELKMPLIDMQKKKGLHVICQEVSDAYFKCMKICIHLSHHMLNWLANGGVSISEHNAKKWSLTQAKEGIIVLFAAVMAERGFPLSPQQLWEHAEQILHKQMGSLFPENGLGKDWTTCFITQHYNQLSRYWSSPLNKSHARAVSPHTVKEYFKILEETQAEHQIPDKLCYGIDETGIQTGVGITEYVLGPKGQSVQHQQQSGNCKNITIIPTICGDGSTTAPAIIYKGEGFQTKWLQENPLDAW